MFYFLYYVLYPSFFSLILWFFLSNFVIPVSVSKISSVLLLNIVHLFFSVPKLGISYFCRWALCCSLSGRRQFGYKHTLKICVMYCFSTATMDNRTLLNVTLYVRCLSWSIYCHKIQHFSVSHMKTTCLHDFGICTYTTTLSNYGYFHREIQHNNMQI